MPVTVRFYCLGYRSRDGRHIESNVSGLVKRSDLLLAQLNCFGSYTPTFYEGTRSTV